MVPGCSPLTPTGFSAETRSVLPTLHLARRMRRLVTELQTHLRLTTTARPGRVFRVPAARRKDFHLITTCQPGVSANLTIPAAPVQGLHASKPLFHRIPFCQTSKSSARQKLVAPLQLADPDAPEEAWDWGRESTGGRASRDGRCNVVCRSASASSAALARE